jgi:hypothetical protein
MKTPVMPKYAAEIKDCIIVYAVCAFNLFSKRKKLIETHGAGCFKIGLMSVLPSICPYHMEKHDSNRRKFLHISYFGHSL